MTDISENGIYFDPDVARFYDVANRQRLDFDFCCAMAGDAEAILDLGCGTGTLAASVARNKNVVGVDPAAPMIEIARERPGGDNVTWVQADARTLRLDQHFDLVMLTGHTFQVFLNAEDQRAVLLTIAKHLRPNGKFVFDTRNPAFSAPKSRKRGEVVQQHNHPQLGLVEAWNCSSYDEDTNILSYENGYKVLSSGKTFSAGAKIRYTPKQELSDMIQSAGMSTEKWLGDWDGIPYHPNAREIIPVGGLIS